MARVTFQKISPEEYKKLATSGEINPEVIYFLTNGTIYTNGLLFGGNIVVDSNDPKNPEMNVLYSNQMNGELKVWDGANLINIGNKSSEVDLEWEPL